MVALSPCTKGLLGDILDDDDDCFLLPSSHEKRSPVKATRDDIDKTAKKGAVIIAPPSDCTPTDSNDEEQTSVKRIRCQFSAQRIQKRKRWADGILIVCEGLPSVSLESADDEGCVIDTIRWTKIIRDKWQTAKKNEQDLTLDSSRHLIRIDADAWSSGAVTSSSGTQNSLGKKSRRRGGGSLLSIA